MKSDIEIAQEATMKPITQIAAQLGLEEESVIPYGRYKAKIDHRLIHNAKKQGKLILVTAISPTPAGEGKTTTSVGLADAMNALGKKTMLCLREPSLGPVFGVKGGAAGGGYAQVVPMEDINLHFTGDLHAIGTANNLLAAMIDNSIQQGNPLNIDPRRITWKRCMDMNDRSLRSIVTGLGPATNGLTQQAGFDITPASELMAILCLATSEKDLRRRIEQILLGYTYDGQPFTVKDLGVAGAITVLLRDALAPNLVQTTENTAAFVHGGPFANIAHGCNSILATKMAMTFGDYVITEAGFGADLGAEKFYDIKCRKSGLQPKLTLIVATAQGLKMHGGVAVDDIKKPNSEGLKKGLANLDKHIKNLQSFGQTVAVVFNRYAGDVVEEIDIVKDYCAEIGVGFAENDAYADGSKGAVDLANLVVDTIEKHPSEPLKLVYDDTDSIEEKIEKVAKNIYGAASISFAAPAKKKLQMIKELGYEHFPICIAKTQFSFSTDAKQYCVASGFDVNVRDIVINAGAEMIVVVAGSIMRMPGLPKVPAAMNIDIVNGEIEGLS